MRILLLAALLLSTLAAPTQAAKNPDGVAVIIGNKNYHGDIPAVDFAHNDAEAIRRYVLDVLGYDPDNIIDLRDASKAEMEAAFGNKDNHKGRLWQYLDPKGGSDILVYYSGHGVPGQNDKRSYMLPANADPAFAEINGYPIDILYKNLDKLKARSKSVLIDACFSGASPKGMLIDAASPVFIKTKAANIGKGMTVLTAASGDQLASWDKEAKHGLFTNYFLEGVYGKADGNKDGRITAAEIKDYLDDKMTRAARRTYRRVQEATLMGDEELALSSFQKGYPPARPAIGNQVASLPSPKSEFTVTDLDEELVAVKKTNVRSQPTTRSNILDSLDPGESINVTGRTTINGSPWYRVVLVGRGDGWVFGSLLQEPQGQVAVVIPQKPAAPKPKTPSPMSDASIAWQSVQNSTNIAEIENFILAFRSSPIADKARARLDELKKQQVAVIVPQKPTRKMSLRPGNVFRDCADCPEMVVIPSDSFQMGDLNNGWNSNEKPVHKVTITRPFAVGKYEVKQSEYFAIMGYNPSKFDGDNRPVENVSWNDAQEYIRRLNSRTGQQYRLLSEAEWEYSARAGTRTKYSCGNDHNCLKNVAWYKYNSGGKTHPVGQKTPNAFGLFDMHGNVWEWVEDCYFGDSYSRAQKNGQTRMFGNFCSSHVIRGGSWRTKHVSDLRAAFRNQGPTDYRDSYFGFRVARALYKDAHPKLTSILPQGTVKEQYSYAFALLRQANYEQAEIALNEFIQKHPNDPLSGNARYWLMESFYVRGLFVRAAEAAVAGYQADPNGRLAADTLLKLGMSMSNLAYKEEACAAFGKLIRDFPSARNLILSKVDFEIKKIGC